MSLRGLKAAHLAVATLLAGAVLFQAYPTFSSFFLADDFLWLSFARSNPGLAQAALTPSPGGWTTPISNLIFVGEHAWFGAWAGGYYLVSAALHWLNALLVFDLAGQASARRGVALGAALIFAVHFAHYSDFGALVWIGAFVQLVVAFFYLAAFCLILRYWRTGRRRYQWGALGAFGLALLSKETALSLPILLTAWRWLDLGAAGRPAAGRLLRELAPFYAVWAVYLVYETLFQAAQVYLQQGQFAIGWHLLTNLIYFSNLFAPNPASPPIYNFLAGALPAWSLPVALGFVWALRLALLAAAVAMWWKGPRALRRWLAWIVICHLPFLGFVEGLAGPNRYFYLSSAGLAVLLAEAGAWVYGRLRALAAPPAAQGVAALLLAGLFIYNLAPARVWQRQMRANSEVRRQVLALVAQAAPAAAAQVYLLDFPARFGDLPMALRAFYDLTDVTFGPAEAIPDDRALVIRYEAGWPVLIQP